MFYAYLYAGTGNQVVHCSTKPISEFVIDPTGFNVISIVFDSEYIVSETLLNQLSYINGVAVSSGPTIKSQEIVHNA